MTVKSSLISSFNYFELSGRLDNKEVIELQNQINFQMKNGSKFFLFDLSGLTYMSSSGLRIFIKTQKELKLFDGFLNLISPNESIKELLEMSELTDLLRLRNSYKEAINEFKTK